MRRIPPASPNLPNLAVHLLPPSCDIAGDQVGSKQHHIPYLTTDLGQTVCLSLCVLFLMGFGLQPLQKFIPRSPTPVHLFLSILAFF